MDFEIRIIKATATYQLRKEVMWPNKPLDFIILEEDKKGIHYGLWKNSTLISVVSLFINKDEAQFRKFATKTSEQGKGYGTHLLNHLMHELHALSVKKVWCNARLNKALFYQRFGMHKTAQSFTKENINYIIMEKNISSK